MSRPSTATSPCGSPSRSARKNVNEPSSGSRVKIAKAQQQKVPYMLVVGDREAEDGTVGVRAVKDAGGMVMAQNAESCEFDGMPRSAIATGLVDYQLPPAAMPAQLMDYATRALGRLPRSEVAVTPHVESALTVGQHRPYPCAVPAEAT